MLVRWLGGVGHTTHRGRRGSSALDILEERFARGEIDRDEFDERKRTLTG
ncbi:MAG: SHOCT domain-containing protein [Alphaproteobacteria bacterium]